MHLGLSWAAYLRAALVRNWLVELDWLEEAGVGCSSPPGQRGCGWAGALGPARCLGRVCHRGAGTLLSSVRSAQPGGATAPGAARRGAAPGARLRARCPRCRQRRTRLRRGCAAPPGGPGAQSLPPRCRTVQAELPPPRAGSAQGFAPPAEPVRFRAAAVPGQPPFPGGCVQLGRAAAAGAEPACVTLSRAQRWDRRGGFC